MTLNVIAGGLPEKQAKKEHHREVELDALTRAIEKHRNSGTPLEEMSWFERMKMAYTIIKFTSLYSCDICKEQHDTILFFSGAVNELLQDMPVDEFIRWFPPKKVYDGEKNGCKDYYSTMETVREYPTITKPDEFLMEYYSPLVHYFMFRVVLAIDGYFKAQGKETPTEQFCRENNIRTYHETILPNGKILLTGSDGSKQVVSKRKARADYLKVVKGGLCNG